MSILREFQSDGHISLHLALIIVVVAATLFVNCETGRDSGGGGPDIPPSGQGTIRVRTRTTGTGIDPDGYMVALDDGTPVAIGINDTKYFEDVSAGASSEHKVELTDIDQACDDPGTRLETVPIDDTLTVDFNVECDSLLISGTIWVSVITGGSSPDDSYYIVVDGTDSTLITTGARLPDTVDVYLDYIAPGSHQVAIVDVAGNCSVAPGDGIQTVEVITSAIAEVLFTVSCTGGTGSADVVYAADGPGGMQQIWVMDSTGNSRVQLTSGSDEVGFPRFSPDGTRIGYYQSVDHGSGNMGGAIFIMNSDGTDKTDVTGPANLDMSLFCWSPDGTMIAGFGTELDPPSFQSKLYTLDLSSNTVAEVLITDFHLFSGYYAIDWSPDGSKFIFHSSGPGGSVWTDIYTVPDNGGIAAVLAADQSGGNGFFNPKYSPDGSMISMHDGIGWGIWTMGNDGSSLTKIIPRTTGGGNPDWLPDGQRIGFTGSVQGGILVTDLSGKIVESIATDIPIYNHEWNKNR
jgi:hypothetical protein